MEFESDTIEDIIESEKQMILSGAECYGEYFINASEFSNLLNNFIKSIDDTDKLLFMPFLSQVRKHHRLALFSAVRRHHIQANMNIRHVIEAGQWTAYAMGNKEQEKFFTKDENNFLIVENEHRNSMYAWLDVNFKVKADETRSIKKIVSTSGIHSDIVYAFNNFTMKPMDDNLNLRTIFFDFENDYRVKTDLWFIANTALGLLDLFCLVNQKYHVFRLVEDFNKRFIQLADQNSRLKIEMMSTDKYKNSQRIASQ